MARIMSRSERVMKPKPRSDVCVCVRGRAEARHADHRLAVVACVVGLGGPRLDRLRPAGGAKGNDVLCLCSCDGCTWSGLRTALSGRCISVLRSGPGALLFGSAFCDVKPRGSYL